MCAFWAKSKMNVRDAMIALAGVPGHGEQPRWLKRVADAANISARAARSLWRGEIHNHNHRAAVSVRNAVELKQARAEARAIADQYLKLAGAMREKNEALYRDEITRLEQIVSRLGDGAARP